MRQAASLEETSASLEQLSATVAENSERALRADALSAEAAAMARSGAAAMTLAEARMDQIVVASGRVSEILGLIDAITFQTNILALNAAVEAARAGEQGRGFAVVAAEVRSLSQRSEVAARDIRALVEASRAEAQSGRQQVGEASGRMHAMAQASSALTAIVEAIARASKEQATGLAEVHRAVEILDATTQSNAKMAERSSADAHALAEGSQGLMDAVARFSRGEVEQEASLAIMRASTAPAPQRPLALEA